VYLTVDDFQIATLEIRNNTTNGTYIGDLSDFPNLTNYVTFNNTNVTGDISALSNLTFLAHFGDTNVTGDIGALSNVNYYAHFGNTNVTGILNPNENLRYLYLNNTQLSINDTDQTVINLDNNTVINNGTLDISGLQRSSASTAAINSLIAKGWSVTDGTVV